MIINDRFYENGQVIAIIMKSSAFASNRISWAVDPRAKNLKLPAIFLATALHSLVTLSFVPAHLNPAMDLTSALQKCIVAGLCVCTVCLFVSRELLTGGEDNAKVANHLKHFIPLFAHLQNNNQERPYGSGRCLRMRRPAIVEFSIWAPLVSLKDSRWCLSDNGNFDKAYVPNHTQPYTVPTI